MLERNNIYRGDCLELMKDIPDKSIDMILCDLPYGTTMNKWDSVIPLEPLWKQYERIIKDNGAIILTAQTPFDKILGVSNLKMLRYEWIWHKTKPTGHLNAKKMPLKEHENVLVFYKKLPIYNTPDLDYVGKEVSRTNRGNYGNMSKTTVQEYTGYPRSVLRVPTEGETIHPTQKPVALFEYLIKTYTDEGDLVLDNCAGSGTTGVACHNTNRDYILIEKDYNYFNRAKERLNILI